AISVVGCGAGTGRIVTRFGEAGGLVAHLDSIPNPLHALDHDEVAFFEFRIHQYLALLALDDGYRHAPRAAILHRPDVSAVGAPLHAGLGDHGIERSFQVQADPEAHARAQLVRFVFHPRPRDEGAGHRVDAAADVDDHAVGRRLPALPGCDFDLVATRQGAYEILRHLEADEERAPVVQRGDHGVGIDPVARIDLGDADVAAEGRLDRAVVQRHFR